ncbi:MAG: hypothetical protein V7767_05685 [Leeuwenhoekiella sp.]
MKKTTLVNIAFLFFSIISFAQTNLYENPQFDAIAVNHKIIAILPFKATVELRPKQMEKFTPDQLNELELDEGASIQNAMHSWFLKRKKRGTLSIEVMEPKRVNALLFKEDITTENLHNYTTEDLAKILGVDAIISGTYETNKPMSDGASIALGLLVGFWGTTNSATINMSINNATDGELLWNYNKKVRGSLGSSSDDLINTLMRKASRRLAYTK